MYTPRSQEICILQQKQAIATRQDIFTMSDYEQVACLEGIMIGPQQLGTVWNFNWPINNVYLNILFRNDDNFMVGLERPDEPYHSYSHDYRIICMAPTGSPSYLVGVKSSPDIQDYQFCSRNNNSPVAAVFMIIYEIKKKLS